MIDPVSEAFTTVVSPFDSAISAIISSAALPKVAFRNPPKPAPVRAEICSVARPNQPARGIMPTPERTKSNDSLLQAGTKRMRTRRAPRAPANRAGFGKKAARLLIREGRQMRSLFPYSLRASFGRRVIRHFPGSKPLLKREQTYHSSTDEQSGQGTAPKNEKKRQKVAIVVSSDSQILITRQVRQASRLAGRCTPPLRLLRWPAVPPERAADDLSPKVFLRAAGFKLFSFSIPMRVDRGIDREETAVAAVS